jgi:hypothetical protein
MKRLASISGLAVASIAFSCTSGDDVYITSKSSALSPGSACCTEFRVGGAVDPGISDNAQARVAAEAIATVAGLTAAAVDDLTTTCRGIAQDLDAPLEKQAANEDVTDKRERLKAWCATAADAVRAAKGRAGGTVSLEVVEPTCSVSARAKTSCQAKCAGAASCDVKANPPTCSGGNLTIACNGTCTPTASAAMKCEGSCSGSCKGSCTSQIGVECAGTCEGTCKGASAGGTGAGIQPNGTCLGTCVGTCQTTAPSAKCAGSCKGECSASCAAAGGGSVRCDGSCDASFEVVSCEGGKLAGGCAVDAKCDANCNALVSATAQCTPSRVAVVVAGAADDVAAARLKKALEWRLGLLFDIKARAESSAPQAVVSSSAAALTDLKAACILSAAVAAVAAAEDVSASLQAVADVVSAVQ